MKDVVVYTAQIHE